MTNRHLNLNLLVRVLFKLMLTTRSRRLRRQGGAGYGYFMLGPDKENVTAMNALLGDDNKPMVSGRSFSSGGGGGMLRGRWRIGGEGEGGGEVAFSGGQRTAYGHGSGGPTLAYELIRLGRLRIVPIIGIGGAGNGLMASEIAAPKTGTALGAGGPFFHAGIGIEYALAKIEDKGSMVVGIRFGYRLKVIAGGQRTVLRDGEVLEQSALDIPTSQSGGPFFRVVIGVRG